MTPEQQAEFDNLKSRLQSYNDSYHGGTPEYTVERTEAALEQIASLVALLHVKGVLRNDDLSEFGVYL